MSSSKIIIDTNIVSYIMKGRPEAAAYAPHRNLTGLAALIVNKTNPPIKKNFEALGV